MRSEKDALNEVLGWFDEESGGFWSPLSNMDDSDDEDDDDDGLGGITQGMRRMVC
jgi:hypothetical protein